MRRARRAADLRRGDDRLPRRAAAARRGCFGVTPDLTCLGKVVGGGLPAAAYGGRRRADDAARARRARLSGGHALGQSARDGRGPRDAATASPARRATSSSTARSRQLAEGLARGRRRRRRRARHGRASAGCSASSSTPARCENFADAQQGRRRALQRFFARDARARHLPRPVSVRGRLRLARPPPARHRGDARRGAPGRSTRGAGALRRAGAVG